MLFSLLSLPGNDVLMSSLVGLRRRFSTTHPPPPLGELHSTPEANEAKDRLLGRCFVYGAILQALGVCELELGRFVLV